MFLKQEPPTLGSKNEFISPEVRICGQAGWGHPLQEKWPFCIGSGSFILATGDRPEALLLPQLKRGLIHGPLRDQLGEPQSHAHLWYKQA